MYFILCMFILLCVICLSLMIFYQKRKMIIKRHWVGFNNNTINIVKNINSNESLGDQILKHDKVFRVFYALDSSLVWKLITSFVISSLISILMYLFYSIDFNLYILLVVGVVVGMLLLTATIKRSLRIKKMNSVKYDIPDMIILFRMYISSGITVECSLMNLAKDLMPYNLVLGLMLQRVVDRANIMGFQKALEQLKNEAPIVEIDYFCNTLLQGYKYGTSLGDSLTILSEDMREMQLSDLEEKISKLASKMTLPMMLLILAPLVVVIVTPGVIKMLSVFSSL